MFSKNSVRGEKEKVKKGRRKNFDRSNETGECCKRSGGRDVVVKVEIDGTASVTRKSKEGHIESAEPSARLGKNLLAAWFDVYGNLAPSLAEGSPNLDRFLRHLYQSSIVMFTSRIEP